MTDTVLKLGKYDFNSRLCVGTGKYETLKYIQAAQEARVS